MDRPTPLRRTLLKGLAAISLGLAGCQEQDTQDDTADVTIFETETDTTEEGTTAGAQISADQTVTDGSKQAGQQETATEGQSEDGRPSVSMNGELVHPGPSDLNFTAGLGAKDDGDGTVSLGAAVRSGVSVGRGQPVYKGNAGGSLVFRSVANAVEKKGEVRELVKKVGETKGTPADNPSTEENTIQIRALESAHKWGHEILGPQDDKVIWFNEIVGGDCIDITPPSNPPGNLVIDYTCGRLVRGQGDFVKPAHPGIEEIAGIQSDKADFSESVCTGKVKTEKVEPSGGNLLSLVADQITLDANIIELLGTVNQSGGDYAEWLPKATSSESFETGDIVGVSAGRVSKSTDEHTQALVITGDPAFIGNTPNRSDEGNYAKVAFIGQVPTKVRGSVEAGELIVPSGKDDGVGVAIAAEEWSVSDGPIVGRAWETDVSSGVSHVKVAVGLDHSDAMVSPSDEQAEFFDSGRENADISQPSEEPLQRRMDELEQEREQFRDRVRSLEKENAELRKKVAQLQRKMEKFETTLANIN